MPKSFDATTKFLVELNPTDWLHLLGLPLGPTRIAEADMSTVSTAADRLIYVEASTPYALLTEFQGNTDETFTDRLLEYVVLSRRRLGVPVVPVAVLLRSFTGHVALRGRHLILDPESQLTIDFRYRWPRLPRCAAPTCRVFWNALKSAWKEKPMESKQIGYAPRRFS
jgi:hypothetical protein